jgi:hypothetical protein
MRRLRYLTGNTRLVNNKKQARVGIYFSNSLLSSSQPLKVLDAFMQQAAISLHSARLKDRIGRLSFKQGFDSRTFHSFTANEISDIVKAWKYAE